MSAPRDYRALFIKRCIIVLFISALFLLVFTYVDNARSTDAQLELNRLKISTLTSNLNRNLSYLSEDLDSLLTSDQLQQYLDNPNEFNRKNLEEHFKLFAETSRRYDQIRLLSTEGMEALRVNYHSPLAKIVSTDKLQDKSNRYYFKEAMALPSHQAYVSRFDLNVENGTVEQPLKPVIRLSRKLYNRSNQFMGVIVLNFLGSPIIKSLELLQDEVPNKVALLDGEGYWIYDSTNKLNWSRQLGDQESFSTLQPEAWKQIAVNELQEFQLGSQIHIHQILTFPQNNTKERQRTLHLVYTLHPHSWLTNPGLLELAALL
ncbi:MAG: cache domain-containing protein, partial [Pseudomonadales bacterium]|nr:cache domain-containing protein [Pseudomonadales bacterium]